MESNKIKKISLFLLIIAILFVVGVFGVFAYRNWRTEKTVSAYQAKIERIDKSFSDSVERNDKLKILQDLIDEENKYSKAEKPIKEVKQNYKQTINSMKSYFVEMYDTEVEQNILMDVTTITDKEALDSAKTNLSALLVTMESEQEVTLSETEYTEYVEKINGFIDEYTNRVAEIEKAEEEARLKAEAEAKAKAEQEAKAKEQASKSDSNASSNVSSNASNSNNNTSSNTTKFNFDPNDDSNLPVGWYHHWDVDLYTGEKIEGTDTWSDPDGNVYGIGGVYLGNVWET